jgi:cytosine/adenosine deaminase-related metal-dependent hydrolase
MATETYAARWVLPVDGEPIPDGEVVVEHGVILEVRPRQAPANECCDFGDAILMPGLINAHTHLEYTALRGFLEDVPFFPWIRSLMAAKASFISTPLSSSGEGWRGTSRGGGKREAGGEDSGMDACEITPWLWSARLGALETIAAGVTTIGDNTDAGVTMQVAVESGLRGIIYQEIFGIDQRELIAPIIEALAQKIAMHRQMASDRVQVGVSPHALYTIRPELFAAINAYVTAEDLPTSIHIAESLDESALTERGQGAFAEMFERRGVVWETPHASPTRYAGQQGALTPQALAVHCVQQSPDDIVALAQSGAAVVHCPKSNAKLGAGIAPLAAWIKTEGLRIALGTDSAVSNNTLDLFEEMRFALLSQRAATHDIESVTAKQIVRIATLGGAEAMNLSATTGSFTPGKKADLIAVSLGRPHVVPSSDPYAALVYSARAEDVIFTLCDGQILYDHGNWLTLNANEIVENVREIRRRVSLTA